MDNLKWQLPVIQSNLTSHDWIHPNAKYHCFDPQPFSMFDKSLCGKYSQDTSYFETGIESCEIASRPEIACKVCFKKWKEFNLKWG